MRIDKNIEDMEQRKIGYFGLATIKIAIGFFIEFFKGMGIEAISEGEDWDTCLKLKYKKNTATFFLANLALEVVTMDRDEKPLRFNPKIEDPEYWGKQVYTLINSKMELLLPILMEDNIEDAKKIIEKKSGNYERITIATIDNKKKD